jgi:hypothetical protein
MRRAITNNLKIIAYHRLHYHDYSHPQRISSDFQPLYTKTQVIIHVDTNETPEWHKSEITWNHEFQLFTAKNIQIC